jgi:protein TonB
MLKILSIAIFLILSQQLYSQDRGGTIKVDLKEMAENKVYSLNEVDHVAHFPGGETAWEEYLLTHSRYPEMPNEYKTKRKVYLWFVIEKNGSITDAVVTRGINTKCDEEALRLLRSSGKWIPATFKSKKVRSKGSIAIKFGFS